MLLILIFFAPVFLSTFLTYETYAYTPPALQYPQSSQNFGQTSYQASQDVSNRQLPSLSKSPSHENSQQDVHPDQLDSESAPSSNIQRIKQTKSKTSVNERQERTNTPILQQYPQPSPNFSPQSSYQRPSSSESSRFNDNIPTNNLPIHRQEVAYNPYQIPSPGYSQDSVSLTKASNNVPQKPGDKTQSSTDLNNSMPSGLNLAQNIPSQVPVKQSFNSKTMTQYGPQPQPSIYEEPPLKSDEIPFFAQGMPSSTPDLKTYSPQNPNPTPQGVYQQQAHSQKYPQQPNQNLPQSYSSPSQNGNKETPSGFGGQNQFLSSGNPQDHSSNQPSKSHFQTQNTDQSRPAKNQPQTFLSNPGCQPKPCPPNSEPAPSPSYARPQFGIRVLEPDPEPSKSFAPHYPSPHPQLPDHKQFATNPQFSNAGNPPSRSQSSYGGQLDSNLKPQNSYPQSQSGRNYPYSQNTKSMKSPPQTYSPLPPTVSPQSVLNPNQNLPQSYPNIRNTLKSSTSTETINTPRQSYPKPSKPFSPSSYSGVSAQGGAQSPPNLPNQPTFQSQVFPQQSEPSYPQPGSYYQNGVFISAQNRPNPPKNYGVSTSVSPVAPGSLSTSSSHQGNDQPVNRGVKSIPISTRNGYSPKDLTPNNPYNAGTPWMVSSSQGQEMYGDKTLQAQQTSTLNLKNQRSFHIKGEPKSSVTGISSTRAQEEFCPEKTGRFPDPVQCDAYVECVDGIGAQKLCPDGLLFESRTDFGYPCRYPAEVDCGSRTSVQVAQPNGNCPHLFGYYKLGDETECDKYLNCANGVGFLQNCPEGLAFNAEKIQCDWPDQVPSCNAESYLGFTCPKLTGNPIDEEKPLNFPHPADPTKYFNCLTGRPRLHTCSGPFNPSTGLCDTEEPNQSLAY